jgi:hypothetical protein
MQMNQVNEIDGDVRSGVFRPSKLTVMTEFIIRAFPVPIAAAIARDKSLKLCCNFVSAVGAFEIVLAPGAIAIRRETVGRLTRPTPRRGAATGAVTEALTGAVTGERSDG